MSRKDDALADALLLLGLEREQVTAATLSQAFRAKAMQAHPDKGGDVEEFHAIKRAERTVAEWLQTKSTRAVTDNACPKCSGRGYISSQKGFRALRMQCAACRGTGEQDYEHDLGDGR
jgi:DnaJ-class molecular chaperone